ncbi:MAG: phosphatase PAP2 family protein [Nitrososphaerales archaeon]
MRAGNPKFLYVGMGFLLLYIAVFLLVASGATQSTDVFLELRINSATATWATPVMLLATNYGREFFWIGVVALLMIFGKGETKILALELAVLFIAGIVVGEGLKLVYYRDRPFATLGNQINLLVPTDSDSSFPSGHALIVGIGAFFSFSKVKNRAFATFLIAEAVIVCYSRVYVGAHYPTDVIGGLAIAAAVAFLGLYFIEGYFEKYFRTLGGYFQRILEKMKIPDFL